VKLRDFADKNHDLYHCALVVRRAGLEHLLEDVTVEEIDALCRAGTSLLKEQVAYIVAAIRAPEEALRPFDGGAAARQQLRVTAFEAAATERTV
jgi:hypothetical protein